MSSDEQTDEPEAEADDVEAHRYVAEEPGEDDLRGMKMRMKMKMRRSDERGGDDFGERAKL